MGSGAWSTTTYSTASTMRKSAGVRDFEYSDAGATKVHDRLDPRGKVRESRDSAEHPQSLAIAVLLDVTGSMQRVPRVLQQKLPGLYGLLLDKRYLADPQIMFGAIGDATCDKAPLQIGQFESDNRADDDLRALLLEGGGGGQMTESYELALYFMARHTSLDCFEKRGKRGYLFIIGDEMPYRQVSPVQVSSWTGDVLTEPLPVAEIVAEAQRLYHVYYIVPAGAAHVGNREVLETWRALLGQNVIELGDLNAAAETIALTIGLGEGAIDLSTGMAHLKDVGSTAGATVGAALAKLVPTSVVATGAPLLPATTDGPVDRL